jgi:Cu/Zn superoxide dismutase
MLGEELVGVIKTLLYSSTGGHTHTHTHTHTFPHNRDLGDLNNRGNHHDIINSLTHSLP